MTPRGGALLLVEFRRAVRLRRSAATGLLALAAALSCTEGTGVAPESGTAGIALLVVFDGLEAGNASGVPVRSAVVVIRRDSGSEDPPITFSLSPGDREVSVPVRFRLPVETVTVVLILYDGQQREVYRGETDVDLREGSASVPATVHVGYTAPPSSIAGTVTGEGSPRPGVTVTLSGDASGHVQTNEAGGFEFAGLEGGDYTVVITGFEPWVFGVTSRSVNLDVAEDRTGIDFAGEEPGGSISGTVRAEGVGRADVLVTVSGAGITPQSTRTSSAGSYSFAGLKSGRYAVAISDFDPWTFSEESRSVVLDVGESAARVDFEGSDPATASISGMVRAEGSPLTNVLVELVSHSDIRSVRTDDSGAYRFAGLKGGNYTVRISDFAPWVFVRPSQNVLLGVGQTRNGIHFDGQEPATGSISGIVTAEGNPLPNVIVHLTGNAGVTTQTDASGRYDFGGLRSGNYTVTISNFGAWDFTTTSRNVTLDVDQRRDDIHFAGTDPASGSISGRVTAAGTGLVGVTLTLLGPRNDVRQTDASGNYTFDGLVAGDYTVTISDFGTWLFSAESVSVGLGVAEDVTGVDFAGIDPGSGSISGRVTGEGQGLRGVTVSLVGAVTRSQATDASGDYVFDMLPAGHYTITISGFGAWDFAETSADVSLGVDEDRPNMDFAGTDPANSSISGTVTAGGSTLSGVTLTLSGPAGGTTTTNGSGAYSFADLNAGNYTVTISNFGPWVFVPVSKSVSLDLDDVEIVDFAGTEPPGSISGTVTAGGSPLANVTVALSGPQSASTTTGVSGTFTFGGLQAGTYTVVISGFSPWDFTITSQPVTVAVGEDKTGVDFTGSDPMTSSISGTVTASGSPLSGVTVNLSGDRVGSTNTDLNGDYTFLGLPKGNYVVAIAGFAPWVFTVTSQPVTLDVAEGKTGIDFAGTASAMLSGQLFIDGNENDTYDSGVDADLHGAGVVVTAEGPSPGQFRTTNTDAAGAYFFSDLVPGSYDVSVSNTDPVLAGLAVAVGTTNPVTRSLPAGVTTTADFGFDIQMFDLLIPVVEGTDGGSETPAANVTVEVYADAGLTTLLGTAVTNGSGIATVSVTRTSMIGVTVYSHVPTTPVTRHHSLVVAGDQTIAIVVDLNLFTGIVFEDHNLVAAAPVISGISQVTVMVSDPSCNTAPASSKFRITANYTDPNGDFTPPLNVITPTHLDLEFVFQPGGPSGHDFGIHTGPRFTSVTGGGASGQLEIEMCYRFGSSTSIDNHLMVADAAGNWSNILTVNIPKPAGANVPPPHGR